ncbi:MAG: HAD family hydrolase, partial [Treponema sp.]|nr:HAD family hydrolase [Treponema sp.]
APIPTNPQVWNPGLHYRPEAVLIHHGIHTVIFDLDGTLSDSALLTMAACKKIAPVFGLSVPTREAVRRATGNPNPDFYYILFPDFQRELVYAMGAEIEKEELQVLPSLGGKLLFPGCGELLEHLKRSGLRLCIASTGDEGHVFPVLRETGIAGLFDSVSCGRPDKTEMLRDLTAEGDRKGYIMVGDMKKDYDAARANGIVSVGACYGYCCRQLSDFDLYIDTPLELLEILKIGE